MIKFNLHLEQLQLHLNSLQYLDSTFARFTSLELLMEIAHLDSESKGYLLHSDITPEELMTNTFFSSFLRREFPLPTIPFTILASYIENRGRKEEQVPISMKPNSKDLLFKFLKIKWQLEELKETIMKNIHQNIMDYQQITLQSFSQYTHLHHLPIDPKTLFSFLTEDTLIKRPQLEVKKGEEKEKEEDGELERIKGILDRLTQRVNLFGNEWLTEKEGD